MLCISKNLKINEEKENVISKDIVFYPTSTNELVIMKPELTLNVILAQLVKYEGNVLFITEKQIDKDTKEILKKKSIYYNYNFCCYKGKDIDLVHLSFDEKKKVLVIVEDVSKTHFSASDIKTKVNNCIEDLFNRRIFNNKTCVIIDGPALFDNWIHPFIMRNDRKTSLILTSPSYKKVEAQLGKKITDIVINSCGIHICCNYQDEDKGYLCKIFGFENSNKFEQCHNYHGLAAIYNGKKAPYVYEDDFNETTPD